MGASFLAENLFIVSKYTKKKNNTNINTNHRL